MKKNKKQKVVLWKGISIDPEIKEKLQKRKVHFKSDQYTEPINQVVKEIQEWNIKQLWFSRTQNSKILKTIENIHFPLLDLLFLQSNRIESLEGISRISFPLLSFININQNRISSIKGLRKSSWNNITDIIMFDNSINDGNSLVQMKFSKRIYNIVIEMSEKCREQIPDISWFLKLQIKKVDIFKIKSQTRIKRDSLNRIILRKNGKFRQRRIRTIIL